MTTKKIVREIFLSRSAVQAIEQISKNPKNNVAIREHLYDIKQMAIDLLKEDKISFLFYVRCFHDEDGIPFFENPVKIQNLINRSRKNGKTDCI